MEASPMTDRDAGSASNMGQPGTQYQFSGKWGWFLLAVAAIGMPLIALCALVYSYAVVYIPIAGYVTFLLLFGYVIAVGMILGMLAKIGKCRSPTGWLVVGSVGGLFAVYSAWVFFVVALVNQNSPQPITTWQVVTHPHETLEIIGDIAENGWYSIKSATPSGGILIIMWLIEAAIIAIAPVVILRGAIRNEMFCEKCTKWCPVKEVAHLTPEQKGRKFTLADANIQSLLALVPLEKKKLPCVRAEVLQCPQCATTRGIRYAWLHEETDKDGKKEEKADERPGVVIG